MGKQSTGKSKFKASNPSFAFSQIQNTGFVGFASGRIPGASLSALSGDLQLNFKKASKKDLTTKLKAFGELQKLFATTEVVDNIDACLDLWTNLFRGLLLDREHRVRKAGLEAHRVLIETAGRKLAPYLKKIICPWVLFMHDSSRSCRNIALESFRNTFPAQKQLATLKFCKDSLLDFISERCVQPLRTLCPTSLAKGIEAEEIYEENMSQCLLSLQFLISNLSSSEDEQDMETLNQYFRDIVSNNKFWNMKANITNSSNLITTAMLSLINETLSTMPEIILEHIENIMNVFIDGLKDRSPQNLWKPLTTIFLKYSKFLSKVTPKTNRKFKDILLQSMREGYNDNTAYNSLIDILQNIPSSISGKEEVKFNEQVLQSLWKGANGRQINKPEAVRCYKEILQFTQQKFYLSEWSIDNESPPSWLKFIINPFNDYLSATTKDHDVISSYLVDIVQYPEYSTEQAKYIFEKCSEVIVSNINEYFEKEYEARFIIGIQHSTLLLSEFFGRKENLLFEQSHELLKSIFEKAIKNFNKLASLQLLSYLTKSVRFSECINSDRASFFTELLPLAKSIIENEGEKSDHTACVLDILSSFMAEMENEKQLWTQLLELFKELKAIKELYSFLVKNITPTSDLSIWKNDVLDEIVLSAIPNTLHNSSIDLETNFKFLYFTLGGKIMTKNASLVSKEMRQKVFQKVIDTCSLYSKEESIESNFSISMIQTTVYMIKLLSDALSTHLLSKASNNIRLSALKLFFKLSVDTKYFWKGLEIDGSNMKVYFKEEKETEELRLSFGLTTEQVEHSPVSNIALKSWILNANILQELEASNRISFADELIEIIHSDLRSSDITLFRPSLNAIQVDLLLEEIVHSATQLVLEKALLPEEYYVQSRYTVGEYNTLIDYSKLPISYYKLNNPEKNQNTSNSMISYPRLLCYLVSLMKKLSPEEIIGKSDARRAWVVCELYNGYTLCKDNIISPIDQSSEVKEEWNMLSDTLIPFINSQFSLSESVSCPITKAIVNSMFSRCKESNNILDFYTTGFIMRKIINGDSKKAENFLNLYTPTLIEDIKTLYDNSNNLLYYQCILPEIIGNLKINQCKELGLITLFQDIVASIMNNNSINSIQLEVLIYLCNLDGILCNEEYAIVLASLFIFFREWENNSNSPLRDATSRIQCLRLLQAAFAHPKMKDYASEHSDFIVEFIKNSIPVKKLSWESDVDISLAFYSFKLCKTIVPLIDEKGQKDIFTVLLYNLIELQPNGIYTPMQTSVLDTLCQGILIFDPKLSFPIPNNMVDSLYPLLHKPHFPTQQVSYFMLVNYIRNNFTSMPSDNIPPGLYALVNSENAFKSVKKSERHDYELDLELGYYYRNELIDFVSFGLSWMILCEYYVKQSSQSRRDLSTVLKPDIPLLLGFIFEYIQTRSPTCMPNIEVNIKGFFPLFEESVDQFVSDLYLLSLSTFPSLVREWWCTDCNRALTNYVEQYTTKYISPSLIRKEIQIILEFKHNYDNFNVTGNSQIREVHAFYEEDEVELEISLHIPDSYPLRDIFVEPVKRIGVTESQWNQWILSIHTLLHTQDANILDAVLLWKNRMDKLFEGIECCLICYSVFQASNNALPRLACKTCKNKFHSACLYKWFNTSHKSNCPLCQTPWME